MRFIGSPPEGLDVEPVGGRPAARRVRADEVGPGLGAADVDVALGDVGDPVAQGGEVVGGADAVAQPGVRARAGARAAGAPAGRARRRARRARAANSGSVGEALQQDRLAGRVVQPLGQRPQRGDADAGADQRDLAPGRGRGR